jgi:integrase/recombinase XerD
MLTAAAGLLHHHDMRDVPVGIDMTIGEATAIWLARYSSVNTRAAYSADLRAFMSWLGDVAAMDATTDDLTQYRGERESHGISSATVDRQFAALRAFYEAARELGLCADNPLGSRPQAVAATSATGTLTPAEVARLHDAAALDPRTAVLVRLLLGEGMRLAEILALDHADVSGPRHAKRLHIVRHGGAASVVLDRAGSRSIGELAQTTISPGPLFIGPSRGRAGSTRLTRFGADHLIKQAATAAGIERAVSANVLRRTHVTTAQRAGVPIDDIRHTMGHIDVRTTRRYLTQSGSDQPTPS